MISPYFSGGGGGANFGPPPGLANLLATKAEVASREQQDGIQNLGKVLSYFANQGAEGNAATGTFNALLAKQGNDGGSTPPGPDAPTASGQPDPTGDNPSAMSRLVNPSGPDSTPGAPGAPDLKHFERVGKLADATFNAISANTTSTQDQEPNVYGVTPTQWKHMGTSDKIGWFQGVKNANDVEQQQQGMKLAGARMLDFAAQARLRDQQSADEPVTGQVLKQFATSGATDLPGRIKDAFAGVDGSVVARNAPQLLESFAKLGSQLNPDGTTIQAQDLGGGRTGYRMPGSKQFEVKDDPSADLLATKPDPKDIPTGHIAVQSGKGWKVMQDPAQWETTTTLDPATFVTSRTQRYIGPPKTGAPAANGYQSAADVKAAVAAGKLDKASAVKILQSQFGMQ